MRQTRTDTARTCRTNNEPSNHSSGATGGIAFAGFSGIAGGAAFAGFSAGAGAAPVAARSGSTEPTACCGADAGRLRGVGGWLGVTAADFAPRFGCVAGGIIACGAAALGIMREPMIEPGGAMSKSSSG